MRRGSGQAKEQSKLDLYENYKDIIAASTNVQAVQADLSSLRKLIETCNTKLRLLRERHINIGIVDANNDSDGEDGRYGGKDTFGSPKRDIPLWLIDVVDDLVTLIHARNYEASVALIERARDYLQLTEENLSKYNSADEEWIKLTNESVQIRCDKLAEELISHLSSSTVNAVERKAFTSYLIRLNLVDAASNIYFAAVTQDIRHSVRSSSLQGDSALHVRKLSRIVFGGIVSAAEVYKELFGTKEKRMLSSFIKWSAEETKEFAMLLQQQVFDLQGVPPALLNAEDFNILSNCLANALHCATEAESHGISVKRQLCHILCPAIGEKINRYAKQFSSTLKDVVSNDDWSATQVVMNTRRRKSTGAEEMNSMLASGSANQSNNSMYSRESSTNSTKGAVSLRGASSMKSIVEEPPSTNSKDAVWLTKSGRYLFDQGNSMISDCKKLLLPDTVDDLDSIVVDAAHTIISNYLQSITDVVSASETPLTDMQSLSVIANVYYITKDLLPKTQTSFLRKAPLFVYKLTELEEKAHNILEEFFKAFSSQRGRTIIQNLRWTKADYSQVSSSGPAEPSATVVPVLKYLISLHEDASKFLAEHNGSDIICRIVQQAFNLMADERGWKRYNKKDSTIGPAGLQKMLLDIHCMAQVGLILIKQSETKLENEEEIKKNLSVGVASIKSRATDIFHDAGGNALAINLQDDVYIKQAKNIVKDLLLPKPT